MSVGAGAGLREGLRQGLSPDYPGEGNSDGHKEAVELQKKGAGSGKLLSSPSQGRWLWKKLTQGCQSPSSGSPNLQ